MNRDDINFLLSIEGELQNYLQRIKNLRESDNHNFINHYTAISIWDKLMELEHILEEIEKDIIEYED